MKKINWQNLLQPAELLKWTGILFSISFFLGIAINSIAFVLFSIVGLVISIIDLAKGELKTSIAKTNVPLLILFLIIVIREATIDMSGSLLLVNRYASFLLIPLIFLFQAKRLSTNTDQFLRAFLIGAVFNASINLGYGIFRGIILNEEGINFWYFAYDLFAEPFGIQPIYLSSFYVFAVLIMIGRSFFRSRPILFYYSLSILVLGIFLLAARNANSLFIYSRANLFDYTKAAEF